MQERSFIRHEQNREAGIIDPILQKTMRIVELQEKFHYPKSRNTKSMNLTLGGLLETQMGSTYQSRGLKFTGKDFYNTLGGANYNSTNTNPNLNQSSTIRKPVNVIFKTRQNFHTPKFNYTMDKNAKPNGC
jgi:hypothetical protein